MQTQMQRAWVDIRVIQPALGAECSVAPPVREFGLELLLENGER